MEDPTPSIKLRIAIKGHCIEAEGNGHWGISAIAALMAMGFVIMAIVWLT